MGFVFTKDAAEFRRHAWALVEGRLEYNVIATILIAVLDRRYEDVQPQFAYRLDDAGAVDAAALRTPPYSMIATELDPAGADELVRGWLHEDPGVSGAVPLEDRPGLAQALVYTMTKGAGALVVARHDRLAHRMLWCVSVFALADSFSVSVMGKAR